MNVSKAFYLKSYITSLNTLIKFLQPASTRNGQRILSCWSLSSSNRWINFILTWVLAALKMKIWLGKRII